MDPLNLIVILITLFDYPYTQNQITATLFKTM